MPTPKGSSEHSELVLGWRVTPTLEPAYWLTAAAKAGAQAADDLFTVSSDAMATHTSILAQSGSGKSVFLGRIVEEIILQTKARCLVLDPNADFRKVYKVEPASLWKRAAYSRLTRRGKLPHERSRKEFADRWSQVRFRIRTGFAASGAQYEPFQISWHLLSMDFLAEDVTPMKRSELYHCHAFVKALYDVLWYTYSATGKKANLINEAHEIFRLVRDEDLDLRKKLEEKFSCNEILSNRRVKRLGSADLLMLNNDWVISRGTVERAFDRFNENALTIARYVSEEVESFYFGRARLLQASGILQEIGSKQPSLSSNYQLEVVDIPSLDQSTRLLAIDAVVRTEWERARYWWKYYLDRAESDDMRVPTFIVVDEAHNLIPNQPRNKAEYALREQFRTVVAEGRKYGLFLILVSQRPDKLDPLILSECENRAVMKLGSEAVLATARDMLGLHELPSKLLTKCLDFEVGRALLVGRWCPSTTAEVVYTAARRTVEGGRNLRSTYWGGLKAGRPPAPVKPRRGSLRRRK